MIHTKKRIVEAEGFRDGAQEVKPDAGLRKLAAQFAAWQGQVRLDSIDYIKRCEAKIDTLGRRKTESETLWRILENKANGLFPPIALPSLAPLIAGLAVGGEMVLLAPVMDGFGIADPFWQYFTAAVLMVVSSGLLKLVIHQVRQLSSAGDAERERQAVRRLDQSRMATVAKIGITTLLTALALTLVFFLGLFRAEEMIFAAKGALGEFLRKIPLLIRILVTLLTIGLPIFVALAFEWGFDNLRLAWEFRTARRAFLKYARRLDVFHKRLEAAMEKRDHQVAVLEEQKKEWVEAYLQSHELGRLVGAQQQPLWQAVIKVLAMPLLILMTCLLLDPVLTVCLPSGSTRVLIDAFATLGFSGMYAYYTIKAWDRPTPLQLFSQRAIQWRTHPSESAPRQYQSRVGAELTDNLRSSDALVSASGAPSYLR